MSRLKDFDLSDVRPPAPPCECDWLRRQCRALLDQRQRAFRLGYQTGREEAA